MFDKSTFLHSRRFSSLCSNFHSLRNVMKLCPQMIVTFIKKWHTLTSLSWYSSCMVLRGGIAGPIPGLGGGGGGSPSSWSSIPTTPFPSPLRNRITNTSENIIFSRTKRTSNNFPIFTDLALQQNVFEILFFQWDKCSFQWNRSSFFEQSATSSQIWNR